LAKILIVEDNALNIKLFCDLLAAHGHEPEAITDSRDLKQITIERRTTWRCTAEQIDVPLTDAREVACEPFEIGTMVAGERDLMAHVAGGKRGKRKVADLDGMIDQLIVVRSGVRPEPIGRRPLRA